MLINGKRSLAYVAKIDSLTPIEGADRIECAHVKGWKCVVKKGEFQPGDPCVYFECDSVLPRTPWSEFLIDKNKPEKPIRLRTIRLRGQLSQGLALPLNVVLPGRDLPEGTPVDEDLGVEKYEPPIPVQLAGKVKGKLPYFVSMTDEERIQNIPDIIKEVAGIKLYTSVKMDGTSFTAYWNANEEEPFGVCSRKLNLKETEGNTYWHLARKLQLEEKLRNFGSNIVIQGEMCGPGIQKNRMGLKEIDLFVFNIKFTDDNQYAFWRVMNGVCVSLGLKTVPVDREEVVLTGQETVDDLLEMADGQYENGHLREGVVFRPWEERYSELLSGRLSFKAVNNKYLHKIGE